MIIGGFTSVGKGYDDLLKNGDFTLDSVNRDIVIEASNAVQGGHHNRRTWMYNTTHWKETAESIIARDRPACSLINMPNGKVTSFSIN